MTLSNLECRVLVNGKPIKTHYDDEGRKWIEARDGSTYTLDIKNSSDYRVLAVISVDGINVINGEPAEQKCENGYVIHPHSSIVIEGWRVSDEKVKSFMFTFNKEQSYAVKLGEGKETLGVIGVAFFRARELEIKQPTTVEKHYHHYHNNPWYWPYISPTIIVQPPVWPQNPIIYTTSFGNSNLTSSDTTTTSGSTYDASILRSTSFSASASSNDQVKLTSANVFNVSTDAVNLSSEVVDFAAGTAKGDEIESRVQDVDFPDCVFVGQQSLYYDSFENLKKRGIIKDAITGKMPQPFKQTKYCEDI